MIIVSYNGMGLMKQIDMQKKTYGTKSPAAVTPMPYIPSVI